MTVTFIATVTFAMTVEGYFSFMAVCLVLVIVPGPTVTLIIANSLRFGVRAGLWNVAGTQVGLFVWLCLTVLGLHTIMQLLGRGFLLLPLLGAIYLMWLGFKMVINTPKPQEITKPRDFKAKSFFWQGFGVIITNPKILVLFSGLIPPFISQPQYLVPETLVLGFTFMAIALCGDLIYAVVAGHAGAGAVWATAQNLRRIEIISGLFLVVGGLWLAFNAVSGLI